VLNHQGGHELARGDIHDNPHELLVVVEMGIRELEDLRDGIAAVVAENEGS
jgi:hypothetical protein